MKTYFIKTKNNVPSISQISLFFFLFVMAICPVLGQKRPNKKVLQPKDFVMWHTLRAPQISGNGEWISCQLHYQSRGDSLFILDANGKSRYQFSNAHSGQFDTSKKSTIFVFQSNERGIGILHLKTGRLDWVQAESYEFSKDGRYLACYSSKRENGHLNLLDIEKNKITTFQGIQNFSFNPLGNRALLIINEKNRTKVELLNLDNMRHTVILRGDNSEFISPIWNTKGSGIAFIESNPNFKSRLYYFDDAETPILKAIDGVDLRRLGDLKIVKRELSISNDGQRIFFWTHPAAQHAEKEKDTVKVQVWHGTDRWLYPRQKLEGDTHLKDMLAVWWPHSGRVFQIGSSERPEVVLSGDKNFAISYNPLIYAPQYQGSPQSDFYITNLETGDIRIFGERLETALGYLDVSPNGKYIAYFKNGDWWLYNIYNNEHQNATENIATSFQYKYAPHSSVATPYGQMGWTTRNEFLIYDEFDIWKVNVEGTSERLTNGRPNKTRYRAYNGLYQGFHASSNSDQFDGYDLSGDIILTTCDSLYNYGYDLRKPKSKIEPLIRENGKISELRKAKFEDTYIFLKETNKDPPALYQLEGRESTRLIQSNPQQYKFGVGKTELVSFKNRKGENLHALLHYPDNYVSGKQYPMIVKVYELSANNYQSYLNPTQYRGDGFNYRNFTAAGYFVLEPDILIKIGNPGISALDCVVAAVNRVLELGVVNKKAIGLIGSSFGGYESAFIISKTDLFSAAVVGVGVFDMVSSYHALRKDWGRSMHSVYENGQWQMGKSFYEDKEGYKNNSPLEFVQNINTPTLIWTGGEDSHVDWHQSQAFYLALRRLNKNVQFLIYENEMHSILEPKNQKDLAERIHYWFDKYLKENNNRIK